MLSAAMNTCWSDRFTIYIRVN